MRVNLSPGSFLEQFLSFFLIPITFTEKAVLPFDHLSRRPHSYHVQHLKPSLLGLDTDNSSCFAF